MAVKILVGGESFDELRKDGCYYVDKTEMIYELLCGTKNKVTLFTRPRRFGKTLAMRMIESFFDIRRDSREVFQGLAIMDHPAFCEEWMNQYPVLLISLKDVEGLTFESAYGMLRSELSDVCHKHYYLRDSQLVSEEDKEVFRRMLSLESTPEDVRKSLSTILRMMHAHFGKPVILLIDEYDVPLAKANEEKESGKRYHAEMLEVIRSIISKALKSNDDLKFAVLTGCLRIAKESIFTGVNNFAPYTVLDENFSGYFGFTQEELDTLLSATDLADKAEVFQEWYDGYVFGSSEVYCPWDVIRYVADLQRQQSSRPRNYWINTSGNGILRDFVSRKEFDVSQDFETLLNGGTVRKRISDELTYDTLTETEENLWSVLLMTGYITKAKPDYEGEEVSLRIPNREVAEVFEKTVVRLFRDTIDRSRQNALMDAFWSGQEDEAARLISDFLWDTISYHDYHENYYQAFLTGLFVGLGYRVQSNLEQGLGRTDITVTDQKNRRAIIIEAKRSDSEAQMTKDCQVALDQISEKRYAGGLYGYTTILCYGVAFFRKSAMVKKLNN